PVPTLRPAPTDPKAGDDLVEHEERAGSRGLLAYRLEEPRRGGNHPHVGGYRLDDDGGDVRAATAQELPHPRRVIELRGQRECRQRGWDTRAVRNAERQRAGPCAYQQRIDVPVVAAREFDDRIPSRARTREAERAHGRLGARAHETHLLERGQRLDQQLRELHLARRRGAEARPVAGAPGGRGAPRRKRGAGQERAPGPDEAEERAARATDDTGALRAVHARR